MNTLYVIGGANLDIFGKSTDQMVGQDSNPGIIKESFGGVGRNIAQNCALLGMNVSLISAIGDDIPGQAIKKDLEIHGIDLSYSVFPKNTNSSIYMAMLNNDNELYAAIASMDILNNLDNNHLDKVLAIIEQTDFLAIDTNLSTKSIEYILENAKCPVFMDPISTKKAIKLKDFLAKISFLKPNWLELEVLVGRKLSTLEDVQEASKELIRAGIINVFVSLGERGMMAVSKDQTVYMEATPTKIVNITGAGDSAMAGIIYMRSKGAKLKDTLDFAQRCSRATIISEYTVNTNIKSIVESLGEKNEN